MLASCIKYFCSHRVGAGAHANISWAPLYQLMTPSYFYEPLGEGHAIQHPRATYKKQLNSLS